MADFKTLDKKIDTFLNDLIRKPVYVKGFVHLVLILYAVKLAPELPQQVLYFVNNQYFKLLMFSLIIWTSNISPSTSLLIALGFMITLNRANNKPMWEFMSNVYGSPTAPSKEIALDAAANKVREQFENTPTVGNVIQPSETIVVQPSVVNTVEGQQVVQPSVVLAPAIVQNSEGETVVVKPNVTVLEAPQSPAPASTSASEAAPAAAQPASQQELSEPAPCFPERQTDMSKVSAYPSGLIFHEL